MNNNFNIKLKPIFVSKLIDDQYPYGQFNLYWHYNLRSGQSQGNCLVCLAL